MSIWRELIADWPDDKREDFEERAAIIEYDGNVSRAEAEANAYAIVNSHEPIRRLSGHPELALAKGGTRRR